MMGPHAFGADLDWSGAGDGVMPPLPAHTKRQGVDTW